VNVNLLPTLTIPRPTYLFENTSALDLLCEWDKLRTGLYLPPPLNTKCEIILIFINRNFTLTRINEEGIKDYRGVSFLWVVSSFLRSSSFAYINKIKLAFYSLLRSLTNRCVAQDNKMHLYVISDLHRSVYETCAHLWFCTA